MRAEKRACHAAAYVSENLDFSLLVDHIDGNKANNHADNLRWVTSLGNAQNSKMPHAVHLNRYNLNRDFIAEYPSISQALGAIKSERIGPVNMANIQLALGGEQDTAYGCVWESVDEEKRQHAEKVRSDRLRAESKRRSGTTDVILFNWPMRNVRRLNAFRLPASP